jgi:hypothetical protein
MLYMHTLSISKPLDAALGRFHSLDDSTNPITIYRTTYHASMPGAPRPGAERVSRALAGHQGLRRLLIVIQKNATVCAANKRCGSNRW